MKIPSLIYLLLFACSALYAQDRKVIASAGRVSVNSLNTYNITYTVGEPVTFTGTNSNNILNNGFNQPSGPFIVSPVGANDASAYVLANGDLKVYPNPFGTYIVLNGPVENEEPIKVQLIDFNGRLILEDNVLPLNYKLEIPQHCSAGMYLLNFYTQTGQFIQQTKMIKSNTESEK
jgi:hypothetical protein